MENLNNDKSTSQDRDVELLLELKDMSPPTKRTRTLPFFMSIAEPPPDNKSSENITNPNEVQELWSIYAGFEIQSIWNIECGMVSLLPLENERFAYHNINEQMNTVTIPSRIVVIDLETTGFGSEDQIIEIGAVEIISNDQNPQGTITDHQFHSFVKPEAEMKWQATLVHGITADILATAPHISSILPEFFKYVDEAPIVSHNISFDGRILDQECKRIGLICSNLRFCTMKCFQKLHPNHKADLDSVCFYYGIDSSSRDKQHGALIDAILAAKVLLILLNEDLPSSQNIPISLPWEKTEVSKRSID
eukprot:NODE_5158_length_1058_cov_41.838503_g4601_i0.p1 GENE.NODE_5158_length_1058_cov_41.838503_g4601_i0~~NODE_5158_length_1058_cov_41.838503_g4601_i0.p1  ORF type:complete len:321 (+),score=46.80 NODE_5158_length_1058_cov_41.838503_g4601_i0:46-963(+)